MGFGIKFSVIEYTWASMLTKKVLPYASEFPSPLSNPPNIFLADNSSDAVPYYDCDFKDPFVLVIGSESTGISDEVAMVSYYDDADNLLPLVIYANHRHCRTLIS